MTPDGAILDRVKKLLRLSTSSNANEAALAASKAQELIDRHQLSQALLDLDDVSPVPSLDEPIQDFLKAGAPLDDAPRMPAWRSVLALALGSANACRIYQSGSRLGIVGRASDSETVRYLYAYLVREVERLTTAAGNGMGTTWRNNFRLGVVDAIRVKLAVERTAFESSARQEAAAAGEMALVRVDKALARIAQRSASVEAFVAVNLKLRTVSAKSRFDTGARQAGRTAGGTIVMGGAKRGLTSGAKALAS